MTPELWVQVEDTFQKIADMDREVWPEAIAGVEDPEVREEVRLLLQAGPLPAKIHAAIASATLEAGAEHSRFGPWRIGNLIGHGGAGAVYEATRDDGVFHQRAAIKILQTTFDPAARERFQQERKILASLNHAYIAHLIDGGETRAGIPCIVMEFIDGQPVTHWCGSRKAGREQILRLFLKICAGVEYAHQRLVVHRDIKPANILVTTDGTPKLLDFGIAKLLDHSDDMTRTGFLPLTPSYASPEQVLGGPITTATDVYSLGVVLYELLTGRTPIKVPTTSPIAITRAICEAPPDSPGLNSDLDNVLLMALRKEPERRYPSVAAFANDIENYLARRVVTARQDSVWYRTSRFLQRNVRSVAAAVVVIALLAAGVVSNQYQARRVQRHFEITRSLASDVLLSIDRELSRIPAATEARRNLIRTVLTTLERLYSDAGSEPALEAELAVAYQRAGSLQSTLPNGEPRQALERAIELGERVRSNGGPDARTMEALARSYYLLGIRFYELGSLADARKNLLLALERSRDPVLASSRKPAAGAARWLGRMENEAGHVGNAVPWMEEAVAAAEEAVRQDPNALYMQELVSARSYLARSLMLSGNLARAAQVADVAAQEGLNIYTSNPNSAEAKLALVSGYVGPASGHAMPQDLSAGVVRLENVEIAVRQAKAMTVEAPTINYWWTWLVMACLQQSRTSPDVRAATLSARDALSIAERQIQVTGSTTVTSRNHAFARIQLAECLHRGENRTGALEQARLALSELAGPGDRETKASALHATLVLASVYEEARDIASAVAQFDQARKMGESLAAADPTDMRTAAFLAMAYEGLGRCSRRSQRAEWFRKNVAVWRAWPEQAKKTPYHHQHLRQAERWLAAAQQ